METFYKFFSSLCFFCKLNKICGKSESELEKKVSKIIEIEPKKMILYDNNIKIEIL